ncbi:zinc ribbon domain-containing protein [Streptomyces sp. NPDC057580]
MAADPRNTSWRCLVCGHIAKEYWPTQEKFHCVSCGHQVHADTVGALERSTGRAGPSRSPTGIARSPTFRWGRSH